MTEFTDLKSKCLAEGNLFQDDVFPAGQSALYYSKSDNSVVWKRPKELCSDPQFRVDGASKYDLDQGNLGNCWFLSGAATVATKAELFDRVVPHDQDFSEANYAGIFHFNFWRFGKWTEVIVDDKLPTKNGKLIFCKNRESPNEFWSALLEKAYAKIHGSYEALESGYSQDSLVDMTGGIGEFIDLRNHPNTAQLFKIMFRTFNKMNSLLCSAIEATEDQTTEAKLANGLIVQHAYSITNLAKFDIDGKQVELVRLRNPWGKGEWNGAWSDGSDEWNNVPDEVKQKYDLTVSDDGEFWMPFDEWCTNFHTFQICHLSPDSVQGGGAKREWIVNGYHGEWIRGITAGGCGVPPHEAEYWLNPQYFVKIHDQNGDDAESPMVLSLIQKYTRLRKTLEKTKNTESAGGIDVYRFKDDNINPADIEGEHFEKSSLVLVKKHHQYEYMREVSCRIMLEPGTYCIIPCTYQVDKEGQFLLRIATEKPIETGEIDTVSEPVKPATGEGKRKFDKLFDKIAGDDNVMDARELRRLLNKGIGTDSEEDDFSRETCRALIASIIEDSRGTLDKPETKQVWKKVKDLKSIFQEYDKDDSGNLDKAELRKAFKAIGFNFNKKALKAIVTKYCGKSEALPLDDFVLLATKAPVAFEAHRRRQRSNKGEGDVEENEWIDDL